MAARYSEIEEYIMNRIPLGNVICDTIKVTVHRAYGIHFARIFEIRTY